MSFKHRYQNHVDEQVDAWLMTYADMITLLLCFFAVFLSVSVPKKAEFEIARQRLMKQFAAIDMPEGKFKITATPRGPFDPVESSPAVDPAIPRGRPTTQDPSTMTGFPSIVGVAGQDFPVEEEEEPEGDRITTIDMNSAPFFASASAALSDEGKKILQGVLQTITSPQYKDFQVTIEGHTDDTPINTLQFPSNWELSTARAAAVARYFIEQGVPPRRLRASGYADTFPKAPNRDALGRPLAENRALNRRVVIKLEKIKKGAAGP